MQKIIEQYPNNLLIGIKGNKVIDLPAALTKDVRAGIEYALFTLEEAERNVLVKKYRLGESLSDAEHQIEKKAATKMLHPCRWDYICHGVAGCTKKRAEEAKREGFTQGYWGGYYDGTKGQHTITAMDYPIETMPLSSRIRNILRRNGCRFIRDVTKISEDKIIGMRKLGNKGISEILTALHSYGIYGTDWERVEK